MHDAKTCAETAECECLECDPLPLPPPPDEDFEDLKPDWLLDELSKQIDDAILAVLEFLPASDAYMTAEGIALIAGLDAGAVGAALKRMVLLKIAVSAHNGREFALKEKVATVLVVARDDPVPPGRHPDIAPIVKSGTEVALSMVRLAVQERRAITTAEFAWHCDVEEKVAEQAAQYLQRRDLLRGDGFGSWSYGADAFKFLNKTDAGDPSLPSLSLKAKPFVPSIVAQPVFVEPEMALEPIDADIGPDSPAAMILLQDGVRSPPVPVALPQMFDLSEDECAMLSVLSRDKAVLAGTVPNLVKLTGRTANYNKPVVTKAMNRMAALGLVAREGTSSWKLV